MNRLAMAALVLVLTATGCQPRVIVPDNLLPLPVENDGPVPGYAELVERYNANLRGLERVWATTDVELAWRDDEGDAHFEKGDGNFIFVPPRNVALTVEKLGKTHVWAGSNDERFWLFERQEDTAYVGRHEHVGKPCAQPLPLPVHPATMPYLLGLVPLDPPRGRPPQVQIIEGYYVIEPQGLALQMMLDPQTARPVRIDLLNARGDSVIVARLEKHHPIRIDGVPEGDRPVVPASADLYVMNQEARMTLKLDRLTSDPSRVRARAFEFEALRKAMKPRRVVELDADCE